MNITNDYYFGIPDDDSSHDDFNTASNIFRFNDELRNYTSFDNQSSTSDLTPIQRAFPFEPIPKMEIFVVRKQKNRGRKKIPNKTKRRKHDKYEDGNVLTKIQVHYFKFFSIGNIFFNHLQYMCFSLKKIKIKYFHLFLL